MPAYIEADWNWLALAVALLVVLLIAWWLYRRASRAGKQRLRPIDVLDEGASPAQRNQALIDAAPAATVVPPPMSVGMAGLGEAIAVAAQDEVEEAAPPRSGETDNLALIKGVGPRLVALLHALGVTRFAEIAGWSEADIDRIDAQLGAFAGRVRKDNWVEQARLLTAGDVAGYEAKFGKL